ncbi:XRE family transcriptional regulator [Mammaliicoccus sp. E-M21]|uniref:XRE family transcriptional regulator n=1 Tax=Mammaliicoccus sp. E-M21 TaxID=2898681 RepID=UPI001EFC013E|nr:XRE family transcriptional regulator [Mammaliicoccus sp. E-M21]
MENIQKIEDKIKVLLDNESLSAAKIGRETGLSSGTIKHLRTGYKTLDVTKFENIKKLYEYQLALEEAEEDNK